MKYVVSVIFTFHTDFVSLCFLLVTNYVIPQSKFVAVATADQLSSDDDSLYEEEDDDDEEVEEEGDEGDDDRLDDDEDEEGEEGITMHPMEVLYTGLEEGLLDSSSDDDDMNSDEEEFDSTDDAVDGLLDEHENNDIWNNEDTVMAVGGTSTVDCACRENDEEDSLVN